MANRIFITTVFVFTTFAFAVPAQEMPKEYRDVLTMLGKKGDYKDNVLKINIPRNDLAVSVNGIPLGRDDLNVEEMGARVNSRMGLNTWAAFTCSDRNAAIAGDVAMLENEVQPVLKALRANNLNIVAIHQHMLDTRPSIAFLHYWGAGSAEKLAAGFKAALGQLGRTNAQR